MSLLYSVPPIRAKARAGLDVLINATGFGALTVFAGWAAFGRPLEPPIPAVTAGFFFLFVAFYPLTQLYQMDEDRARGDSTLALAVGKRNALRLALASAVVAFAFFLGEAWLRFRNPASLGLALVFALWLLLLIPWLRRAETTSRADEQRGFYRALWIWALTDVAVVLGMAGWV
jgi:4-hydroxybenzoate polyprenyltransferase